MAAGEPEIIEGIKRRPSNRDQLISKVIKDVSKSIINLFKEIFLDCAGSVAQCTKSRRQKIRDHASRRVSQIMPQYDQTTAVRSLQPYSELPEHVWIQKRSTIPVIAVGIQVGEPTPATITSYKPPRNLDAAPLPNTILLESPPRQTDPDHEQSQPLIESILEDLELHEIFPGNAVVVSPLEPDIKLLSIELERVNAASDEASSTKRSLGEDITSNKGNAGSRSNHGSISYTVPGAWPKSASGSVG